MTRRRNLTRGFSLVEVTIALVVVGGAMAASLAAAATAAKLQQRTTMQRRAQLLVDDLLAEIQLMANDDPDTAEPAWGPELEEDNATRAGFDDFDDYFGWASAPPVAPDGTPLLSDARWSRAVVLRHVDPNNPVQFSPTPTGVVAATVIVRFDDRNLASETLVRTSSWRTPPYNP